MIEIGALIIGAFGVAGIIFGAYCYAELRKWARQCQNARIAIAHKGRVQINAPLVEWVTWANQLERDDQAKGRMVYRNGHVSVSILRPDSRKPVREAIARARNARRKTTANEAT